MLDVDEIYQVLQRDGVVFLPALVPPEQLSQMQEEFDSLFASDDPVGKRAQTRDPIATGEMVTVSPNALAGAEARRFEHARLFCCQQEFQTLAQKMLEVTPVFDRMIYHRSIPGNAAVTEWHADIQMAGRLSFKVFVYLTEASADCGAFSYVPKSHRLVPRICEYAQAQGLTPRDDAHNFEQIRNLSLQIGDAELKTAFEAMDEHIESDYQSDNFYSMEGPPGSVLLFDTKGIHRGGVPREGRREIVRAHYFQPVEQPSFWRRMRRRLVGGA